MVGVRRREPSNESGGHVDRLFRSGGDVRFLRSGASNRGYGSVGVSGPRTDRNCEAGGVVMRRLLRESVRWSLDGHRRRDGMDQVGVVRHPIMVWSDWIGMRMGWLGFRGTLRRAAQSWDRIPGCRERVRLRRRLLRTRSRRPCRLASLHGRPARAAQRRVQRRGNSDREKACREGCPASQGLPAAHVSVG